MNIERKKMSKVAVVYWSGTGNTEAMAKAVSSGAETAGASVSEFKAAEFSADMVGSYDGIAFGCPAMGAEVLEESEFQPMWDSVKNSLGGKKVGLFGSWGWGGGEWMNAWKDEAAGLGINVVSTVTAQEAPDDSAKKECAELGRLIAG